MCLYQRTVTSVCIGELWEVSALEESVSEWCMYKRNERVVRS